MTCVMRQETAFFRAIALSATALFALSLPGKSWPDTIYLKNGKVFEGHILAEDASGYTVEIGGSIVTLPTEAIGRVDRSVSRVASLKELGDASLRKGDYDLAREYYIRARQTANDTEGLEARIAAVDDMIFRSEEIAPADKAFEEGNFRLAADLYSALYQVYPGGACGEELRKKAAKAYYSLAHELTDNQQHREAVFELSRAIELDPGNPTIHAQAGLVLARQGSLEAAYHELAMALEGNPLEPMALEGVELYGRGLENWIAKREAILRSDGAVLNTLDDFLKQKNWLEKEKPALFDSSIFNLARLAEDSPRIGSPYSAVRFKSQRAISIFLQAYNAGPGAVTLYKGKTPYKETREYVPRVASAFEAILNKQIPPSKYDDYIKTHALAFGFEPDFIRAIVKVESNFNPKCVSTADARGLIQLVRVDWEDSMKRLGKDLDYDKHVFDPDWNLFIGCYYLRWLYDDYLPKAFPDEF